MTEISCSSLGGEPTVKFSWKSGTQMWFGTVLYEKTANGIWDMIFVSKNVDIFLVHLSKQSQTIKKKNDEYFVYKE